jgi:hypothetical protein
VSVEKGWVRVDGPGDRQQRVDAGGKLLLAPQAAALAKPGP